MRLVLWLFWQNILWGWKNTGIKIICHKNSITHWCICGRSTAYSIVINSQGNTYQTHGGQYPYKQWRFTINHQNSSTEWLYILILTQIKNTCKDREESITFQINWASRERNLKQRICNYKVFFKTKSLFFLPNFLLSSQCWHLCNLQWQTLHGLIQFEFPFFLFLGIDRSLECCIWQIHRIS